jgi:hypothetical protein
MSYKPVNTQTTFVDASIFLPDDEHQLRLKLTDSLRDYATGINTREIGQYYLNEIQTGGTLYSPTNAQKGRSLFRKTINFGVLPNAASKSVAHGITITSSFEFVKIDVVGNNPTGTPNFSVSIPDMNSTVMVDANNVIITTTVDYSAYTTCSVILEYVKV